MNKHGLYSKAAQIIRGLQQERGTADQMVAAAKKVGIKDAELQNALPLPSGKVTRDELAQHFEDKVPKLYVNQYGDNPSYLSREGAQRFRELYTRPDLSPEEGKELSLLKQKSNAQPNVIEDEEGEPAATQYSDYKMPGGESERYRERLIELNNTPAGGRDYQSSHWSDHTNVLAHIRMQDRKAGDKRLLHVEEVQSDWGQGGREQGFAPQQPQAQKAYDDYLSDLRNRYRDKLAQKADASGISPMVRKGYMQKAETGTPFYLAAEMNESDKHIDLMRAIDDEQAKLPAAPYVQNTQHWTDLALKNVLREAALGNYDGVVFTPGKAQADRYGIGDDSGMKGYYDNILPKSVTSLAKQHDPDIKPGEPVQMGDYQGFHLPMTDKLKQGILNDGFPAFKNGGGVRFAPI